jgi:hypothetical protein
LRVYPFRHSHTFKYLNVVLNSAYQLERLAF